MIPPMRRLLLLAMLISTSLVHASENSTIARAYLRARCRVLSQGATAQDIDRVLALLSDDVVIQHPRANAVVEGREAVRRGIASHVDEYTGTAADSGIELLSIDEEKDVVVMKVRITFFVGEGETRQEISRQGFILAEIAGSRIKRLIEY